MSQKQKFVSRNARNRGVALLGVLAIVGVCGMLAAQLVSLQSVSIAHVQLTKDYDQLLAYVSGLEELFAARLLQDWLDGDDRPYDNLDEEWASTDIEVEIPDSEISIRVSDLQSLFNGNSLNDPDSLIAATTFQELCSKLNLPYDTSPKIQDWVDEDSENQPSGGEDFDYLAYDPPFRTPNQLAWDMSEVNFFLILNDPERDDLINHVTMLPTNQLILNINTVLEPVLEALLESVNSEENVNSFVGNNRNYTDIEDLIADYPFFEALRPNIAFTSNFFKLDGTVEVTNLGRIDFTSEFFRHPDSGDVTIYKRKFGERHQWEDLNIH